MNIYRANILFTAEPTRFDIIEHGYIVVDDEGLVVGTYTDLPARYASCAVTDYGDRILIPAMNDLHLHAPQYRNMGLAMDMQLLDWLQTYTFPEERKFEDMAYAESIYSHFVHELWKQGTMRSAIFGSIHREATILLADKLSETGMGAYVGLVGMDSNCPSYLQNTTATFVRDMEMMIEHLSGNPLVRPILTPRFVPTCTNDMLTAMGTMAERYGLPVQSHLSENQNEIRLVRQLHPEATCYGDVYHRHGLFGQTPTLMAHCVFPATEEIRLMQQNGVRMVHCPTSNCNLASGMAHVNTMRHAGIKVALGTDISAGHTMSMFRVIQYALQISKMVHVQSNGEEPFLSLSEAFWMATKSGGEFFGRVGSFESGYAFDALVIDDSLISDGTYTLPERIERFIYLGDDRQIEHRFCQGREIKEPRRTKK